MITYRLEKSIRVQLIIDMLNNGMELDLACYRVGVSHEDLFKYLGKGNILREEFDYAVNNGHRIRMEEEERAMMRERHKKSSLEAMQKHRQRERFKREAKKAQ